MIPETWQIDYKHYKSVKLFTSAPATPEQIAECIAKYTIPNYARIDQAPYDSEFCTTFFWPTWDDSQIKYNLGKAVILQDGSLHLIALKRPRHELHQNQ